MKRPAAVVALLALLLAAGCAGSMRIDDPLAELKDTSAYPSRQLASMQMLDESAADDDQYSEVLHGMMWRPGYTTDVREVALERLAATDPEGLKRTIRQRMPRLTAMQWLRRLSKVIAERGWDELTPALVSSWARPMPFDPDETKRPEYQALVALHGEDNVVNVIFDLFVESRRPVQQGLRTRCWDLLHRLGYRDRLVELVSSVDADDDDALLIDLHAGAAELGIIPRNREEILWLRKLRRPEAAAFWDEAVQAMAMLPEQRKLELELRDLPIVVSAARHSPELLEQSTTALYQRVEGKLDDVRHHFSRANYGNLRRSDAERLRAHRDELTWGDLVAMLLAISAFDVPEMVDHLFHYAERDQADETSEYGGVIALDHRGRYELIEFPPAMRRHDQEFIASQAMLDKAYTSLFHFHLHVQQDRNADHAGPGYGDLNYADNTRANCLVFTFVNRDTLNMDFYRHGRVIVDLGEIHRR